MNTSFWMSSDSAFGWKPSGSPEWTNADLSTFVSLACRGFAAREIAEAMGRSEQDVLSQARRWAVKLDM